MAQAEAGALGEFSRLLPSVGAGANASLGDAGRLEMAKERAGLLNSQAGLVQEQIRQLQAHIALYRAMGGGWNDKPVLP